MGEFPTQREEAITVLKGLLDNPLFNNQHRAAFNIAIHDIKAHHDWDINNLILINKDNYEPLEQEPQSFEWCETCKEYDQENHCCHRWSKAIRDTVEEMKQEYIEREVIDRIKAKIEQSRYGLVNDGLDLALNIINECIAESEDKE